MQGVYLKRTEILEKIKRNLEGHATLYKNALEGYRKAAEKEILKMLEDVKNGKSIRRFLSLDEPINHTDDYKRVIEMLEMSDAESIQLSMEEFERYIRDKWEWSERTYTTNSQYIN